MTLKEMMEKRLHECGLWPKEIETIMAQAMSNTEGITPERWVDSAEGYPVALLATVWMSVQRNAVDWIDKNKPQHFSRHVLTEM